MKTGQLFSPNSVAILVAIPIDRTSFCYTQWTIEPGK